MAVRVSETDYIVALPGAGRFGAQAGCLSALREVLTFFLGQLALTPVLLFERHLNLAMQTVVCRRSA